MNTAERQKPRPGELVLDHVAHFVADLDVAASVFEKVALKVTPLSVHKVGGRPLGTSNRCVMFDEGYVELLSGAAGSGLRLACFGTPEAAAERRRLADHGFKPGAVVDLSRKIPSGKLPRFKVVRPGPETMPEGRIQYCQHLTPRLLWRAPLINRMKLTELFVVADDPPAVAARWGRFAGLLPRPAADGIRLETARGAVVIARSFPWETPPAPALAGYGLACRHPEAFAARCSGAGIALRQIGSRYAATLPAALGGAWVF